MPTIDGAKVNFQEAIDFFGAKINIPTDRWDDLTAEEHAYAFASAGATSAELLMDLRSAVDQAITQGTTRAEFLKQFDQIVANRGWSYRGGRDWRANLIYQQNTRAAYGAGRYQQARDPDVMRMRPFWQYLHGDSRRPRLSHLAHDRKVYPADSPFWQAFSFPAGFGCRCGFRTLNQRDLDRLGLEVEDPPPVGDLMPVEDERGQVRLVENSPDPGFGFAPDAATMQANRQQVLQNILQRLDPALRPQVEAQIRNIPEFAGLTAAVVQALFRPAVQGDLDSLEEWDAAFAEISPTDGDLDVQMRLTDARWVYDNISRELSIMSTAYQDVRAVVDQQGRIQAIALIADTGQDIYVDYLTSAPWNAVQDERSVRGAGRSLMVQIARESIEKGYDGRIELLSLESARGFYERLGFELIAPGSASYRLTPEAAAALISEYGDLVEFMESDRLDQVEQASGPAFAVPPRHQAAFEAFQKLSLEEKRAYLDKNAIPWSEVKAALDKFRSNR